MNNAFNYIEYYKNVSFKEYSYNSIDSLIFSLLSYVELEGIVPNSKSEYIYLDRAIDIYLDKFKNVQAKDKNWLFPNCYKLMTLLKNSIRYKNMKLYNHRRTTDKETQFSGITIRLDGITYISYRGTDSSVIGWKEDFELMYKYPTVSQKLAQEYFDSTINFFDRKIYLGGHSKGGNLSMYAYMYGKSRYKKRVKKVYNFDGPGFLEDVINSDLYKDLASKLCVIVPKYSMAGMFLENSNFIVVNCFNKGVWAHDGFSWEVFGGFFVRDNLSSKSIKLKDNLKFHVNKMSLEERREFVENTFNIFNTLGIEYTEQLQDLKINDVIRLMKDIKHVPNKTKTKWITIIKLILIG